MKLLFLASIAVMSAMALALPFATENIVGLVSNCADLLTTDELIHRQDLNLEPEQLSGLSEPVLVDYTNLVLARAEKAANLLVTISRYDRLVALSPRLPNPALKDWSLSAEASEIADEILNKGQLSSEILERKKNQLLELKQELLSIERITDELIPIWWRQSVLHRVLGGGLFFRRCDTHCRVAKAIVAELMYHSKLRTKIDLRYSLLNAQLRYMDGVIDVFRRMERAFAPPLVDEKLVMAKWWLTIAVFNQMTTIPTFEQIRIYQLVKMGNQIYPFIDEDTGEFLTSADPLAPILELPIYQEVL